jgi:hypothetical protein
MRPDWKIGSPIYTAEYTVERIRRSHHGESIFRRPTGGDVKGYSYGFRAVKLTVMASRAISSNARCTSGLKVWVLLRTQAAICTPVRLARPRADRDR